MILLIAISYIIWRNHLAYIGIVEQYKRGKLVRLGCGHLNARATALLWSYTHGDEHS